MLYLFPLFVTCAVKLRHVSEYSILLRYSCYYSVITSGFLYEPAMHAYLVVVGDASVTVDLLYIVI